MRGCSILLLLVIGLDRMALATLRPPKRNDGRKVGDLPFKIREHTFISLGQELKGWLIELVGSRVLHQEVLGFLQECCRG